MTQRLSPATAVLLTVPPLMWAGNAVVGQLVQNLIGPMALNFLRWLLAFAILLPLAPWVLRRASPMWPQWRHFALLGLLGVGAYNALLYLALHTSSPVNVTLVGASAPLWTLLIGARFFRASVTAMQLLGALLSIAGVAVVLARGELALLLRLQLVPGDLLVMLAAIAWAWYSWLLALRKEAPEIRSDWAAMLIAQVAIGLVWAGLFAGAEWTLNDPPIHWGWPLACALLYVAVGPSLLAYRCWGVGVQRSGPTLAGFFSNLTPLFAALMSAAFLGELPKPYHALAFALIVAGILVSARSSKKGV